MATDNIYQVSSLHNVNKTDIYMNLFKEYYNILVIILFHHPHSVYFSGLVTEGYPFIALWPTLVPVKKQKEKNILERTGGTLD